MFLLGQPSSAWQAELLKNGLISFVLTDNSLAGPDSIEMFLGRGGGELSKSRIPWEGELMLKTWSHAKHLPVIVLMLISLADTSTPQLEQWT